jgi:hypothetical protein
VATVAQPLPESAQSGRQELRLEAAEASAPGRTRKRDGAPIGGLDSDDRNVAEAIARSVPIIDECDRRRGRGQSP